MNTDGHINADEAAAFCAPSPGTRRISPLQRLQISDHAAACPACRALLDTASRARPPQQGGRAALIGEMEAMRAAARSEEHREREDIRIFASRLDSFPEEHFSPGGTLPPFSPVRETGAGASGREMPRWWETLFSQLAPLLAAAVVVVMVCGAVSLLRHNTAGGKTRFARTAPPLLRDGPVTVTADGSVQGAADIAEELRAALASAVARRRLPFPGADLGTLRGGSDDHARDDGKPAAALPPAPLDPPAGSVVETVRPTFRWTGVPGGTGYVVEVSSLATDEIITSGPLAAVVTAWQPEAPMPRGDIYRWKVRVLGEKTPGQPGASASLKILGDADEAELRRLRSSPRVSRLVLATACARLNLRSEAKAELQALRTKNPGSPLAADLAASIP